MSLKLSCDSRFQRAFTACCCIFKVITLVWANQGNYFENTNACSKHTLKTTVATQLKWLNFKPINIIWQLDQSYNDLCKPLYEEIVRNASFAEVFIFSKL